MQPGSGSRWEAQRKEQEETAGVVWDSPQGPLAMGPGCPHKDQAPCGAVQLGRQLLQVLKPGACHLLEVQPSRRHMSRRLGPKVQR